MKQTFQYMLLGAILWAHTAQAEDTAVAPEPTAPATQTKSAQPLGHVFAPDSIPKSELNAIQQQLQDIWTGTALRRGITAVHVVDAQSGQEIYSVHADDGLNPASNVKLVSTATAIDLLGPDWRYQTRLLGPISTTGSVYGSVYLYGNHDPTLSHHALTDIAGQLRAQGIERVEGDILLSEDMYRDTIGSSARIIAQSTGTGKPTITVEPMSDFIRVINTATTRRRGRSRLRVSTRIADEPTGPVLEVRVAGRIRANRRQVYSRPVHRRSTFTGHTLKAALQAAGIEVTGDVRLAGLEQYVAELNANSTLPVELAVHRSRPVSALVRMINKRSLNHLADRLVMTAAAQTYGGTPTMDNAVLAMRDWMTRSGVDPNTVVLDSGSGLSYKTELSAKKIVGVLRVAAGYQRGSAAPEVFRESLSIGGVDGTLRDRFHDNDEQIIGKTGTLTGVIALSGFVTTGDKELCFSIVTNGNRHRRRNNVRREHEALVDVLHDYLSSHSEPRRPISETAPTRLEARPHAHYAAPRLQPPL